MLLNVLATVRVFNITIFISFVLLLDHQQMPRCTNVASLPSVMQTQNAVPSIRHCWDIFSSQKVADEYAYNPLSSTCYLIDSTSPASPVSVDATYCFQHYSRGNTHTDTMKLFLNSLRGVFLHLSVHKHHCIIFQSNVITSSTKHV